MQTPFVAWFLSDRHVDDGSGEPLAARREIGKTFLDPYLANCKLLVFERISFT